MVAAKSLPRQGNLGKLRTRSALLKAAYRNRTFTAARICLMPLASLLQAELPPAIPKLDGSPQFM
jgi:hypothetical protein